MTLAAKCATYVRCTVIDSDNRIKRVRASLFRPRSAIRLASRVRYVVDGKCALAAGNESVPIQLAQCRFPELAISINIFSNNIYGSYFVKQYSETVTI